MSKRLLQTAIAAVFIFAVFSCKPQDGVRTLHIYTTNDIHGHYFDSTYVGTETQGSLLAVSEFINARRAEYGKENVILLDAGDIFQGDNAAYYYNYIDAESTHIYTLMARYMGYDAATVGNHDIETGPAVYNRIKKELDMPFLAANAIDPATGKCHFREYTVLKRQGLKIAVIGLTNPSMRTWLGEDKLDGMEFMDPMENGWGQALVDRVRKKENPDAVIFMIHAGSGKGDGSSKESQGLDLYQSLKGVDLVVSAHDHASLVRNGSEGSFMNSGSHCRSIAHAELTIEIKDGSIASKSIHSEITDIDKSAIDSRMAEMFHPWYLKVKEFSNNEIGSLEMEMRTNDAYKGMNSYLNFIHSVCLQQTGADVSFMAPLKQDGVVKAGTVIYNDLFTIYPYENQLYVLDMTGSEIKTYLEASYDGWIRTVSGKSGEHALNIVAHDDPRTGLKGWSFAKRSYNFDSAAGINYTVDVTAAAGKRVNISGFADGRAFDPDATYSVTTTSYRVNGGGGLMAAAGLEDAEQRITRKDKEIRDFIYDYFLEHGSVTEESASDPAVIGSWKFVPEQIAAPMIENDMKLLFGE